MCRRKSFYVILIFWLSQPLWSNDDVLWKNLRPGTFMDMRVLDDFEDRVKWNPVNSLAVESTLRFVMNNPQERGLRNYGNSKLEGLFQREVQLLTESSILHRRKFSSTQQFSQELLVFFAHPGIDFQYIAIPEKDRHFITGRPVAISLWVFGKNKKHVLYALFSNQVQTKIPVKIGDLNFQGWKRLEVPVPVKIAHRNRLNHKVLEFRFDGFKIMSHPNENAGSFSFLHDLVSVLVDTSGGDYAGSEIKDSWK